MSATVLLGDCLDLMPAHVADKSVQLIIADLPFGVTRHPADKPIPMERLWPEFNRVIADNGCIALFCQGKFFVDIVNSNPKMFRYDLIWDKILITGFLNSKRMPLRGHETIAIFYKKLPIYNPQMKLGKKLHSKGTKYKSGEIVNQNYGKIIATDDTRAGTRDKYPTSILSYRKPHPAAALHRTEKSVPLLEWLIKTYTNTGDLVLDPVAGSFSTGIAAVNTYRNFVGMELDPEEYWKGRTRMENHNPLII